MPMQKSAGSTTMAAAPADFSVTPSATYDTLTLSINSVPSGTQFIGARVVNTATGAVRTVPAATTASTPSNGAGGKLLKISGLEATVTYSWLVMASDVTFDAATA